MKDIKARQFGETAQSEIDFKSIQPKNPRPLSKEIPLKHMTSLLALAICLPRAIKRDL